MRHDAPWKRTLRRGVRQLFGVPEDGTLQTYVGERGVRAVRSLERLLQGLGIAPSPAGGVTGEPGTERVARVAPRKFDLGPGVDRGPVREHIPWGYGEDRVTAMPVDPDRLYVYWEVTDEAIAAARRGLGEAGDTAWLSLRVYDVTGRIFDGTNAHAYFDHRVERHDRQWFFTLGRPGSTVCVDVGMKSIEGYFVRIARSGRVDLPRATTAAPVPVEWMTVREQGGEIEDRHTDVAQRYQPTTVDDAVGAVRPAAQAGQDGLSAPATQGLVERDASERHALANDLHGLPFAWPGIARRTEWGGDVERTSWQAGPFAHSVTPPSYEVVERRSGEGRIVETPQGRMLVEQPWSVTIRGIGARLARRVIGRWEIVRALPANGATEEERRDSGADAERLVLAGGSESLTTRGASEARLARGSEERLGGASEELFVGASELRYGGASERLLGGASESRWAGASERRWQGASELRYGGASERVVRGGSEERLAGGSTGWRVGGASELPIGASERHLGGSERWLAGADGTAHDARGPVADERSARASWQAFAAAGSRLAPPRATPGPPVETSRDAAPAPRTENRLREDAPPRAERAQQLETTAHPSRAVALGKNGIGRASE